jgi:hypothetical protein
LGTIYDKGINARVASRIGIRLITIETSEYLRSLPLTRLGIPIKIISILRVYVIVTCKVASDVFPNKNRKVNIAMTIDSLRNMEGLRMFMNILYLKFT